MPFIQTFYPHPDCIVGIWKRTEEIDFYQEFIDRYKHFFGDYHLINHPKRRLEYIAIRYLLFQLCEKMGVNFGPIVKHASGKPSFKNHNIHFSITHSHQMHAAILHRSKMVGIDIEKVQPRFQDLAHKFLNINDIVLSGVSGITTAWTIKECIYKMHSENPINMREDVTVRYSENTWKTFSKSQEVFPQIIHLEEFILAFSIG